MPLHPDSYRRALTSTVETAKAAETNLVIEIAALRPTLLHAGRLALETAIIPTALLFILLNSVGLTMGLVAALGWCYLTLAARWVFGRRLPGTMFVCVGMISSRAIVALLTSSAVIYLLSPALGSVCMALLFLGSALAGRPVTIRLARDFIALPAHILERRGVRRMFTQVALLWGLSRLADAGMSVGLLHFGVNTGLLSRGVFSPILTAVTIVACAGWGIRSLRRDGVRLRLGPAAAPAAA